jgi:PAS domain S-box-containing protein
MNTMPDLPSSPESAPLHRQPMVDHAQRLEAVARSQLVYSAADPLFDELCELAAENTGVPIALVTVLDEKRQFFKSRVGLDTLETPVEWSFCQHAIQFPDQVLTIGNALEDERVRNSPLVTGEPHIRAYMGAPLVNRHGHALGTLCVIDREPRTFTAKQAARLAKLARLTVALIDHQEQLRGEMQAQQKQAELASRKLVTLLAHALDVQAYADIHGFYRYVNPAFSQAFGLDPAQIKGRHIADITGPQVYEAWIRAPFEQATTGLPSHYRRLADQHDKGLRWIDVDLFPARDEAGEVDGVVIRVRDVHDIVVAQEATTRRLINQQQFLNVLAHDVREPLRTVRGCVSLAIEEAGETLSPELRDLLLRAQRGGKGLSVLIEDLLAFVRADGEEIRTEPVDLSRLVASVVEDLGELVREHAAVVTFQGEASEVIGARVWLRVLVQNLIANSIKYARPGVAPRVTITTRMEGDQVTLGVRDNGAGIAADDLGQLFRPFVRLAAAGQVPGSGLGLALCQRVAELHGSRIEVDSTVGCGSCFYMSLPLAQRCPGAAPL